ncbi:DtxR family iron (metal) dependent repressor [Mesonia algae]|uniref:Transcriptional regulator MntR n=1 Tax=Mesonia algae TaxID=213248 RepID=A0A2W7IZE9_9FLAO|nr:metal-dependent transcriptional regulator [Mesonia algae]PZW44053.1 DtxR family iron (metal) dependent repressor [Mesonia algae]
MTLSEENYLKAVYHLELNFSKGVPTNAIAEEMKTKASSATDMIKRLAEKKYLSYKPYQGAKLTANGKKSAIKVIRKHRLWECFLVEKLNFNWDEVHDVAEQLEHIQSEKLTEELDKFLGRPTYDPHGDPIPDANGNLPKFTKKKLSELNENEEGICKGFNDDSSSFLKFLAKQDIGLNTHLKVTHIESFDESMTVLIKNKEILLSKTATDNIYVESKS